MEATERSCRVIVPHHQNASCECVLPVNHPGEHACARPAEHVAGIRPYQRTYEVTATVRVPARTASGAAGALVDALNIGASFAAVAGELLSVTVDELEQPTA